MQRLVRLLRVDSDARCAEINAEAATKTGASAICADPANNDTNMETIKASATRKSDGWAPTLEYQNGGRVIGQQRCGTMEEATGEASDMIGCMSQYPEAFRNNHPTPNQLIDLSNA
jgi:hypothetical protein